MWLDINTPEGQVDFTFRVKWMVLESYFWVSQSVRPSWLRASFGTRGHKFASLDFLFLSVVGHSPDGGPALSFNGHSIYLSVNDIGKGGTEIDRENERE
jgi:hypothetical protein